MALAVCIKQASQLHAQRAGVARLATPEFTPCRFAGGLPVDPVMFEKVLIFGDDDGADQCRQNLGAPASVLAAARFF